MLKYPVVFVHGIVAHDRKSFINFWGRIPDYFKNNGIDVFFGNTDAWGRIESNAKILNNTIEKVLQKTKKNKVNIIAHSKGGIDSRYYIWKHSGGNKTASLTTISTPHNGAELADLIFNQSIIHTKKLKRAFKIFGKLYGDHNPDPYKLNDQLTSKSMEEFNRKITADKKVYYQSLYSTMKNAFDDLLFFYSYNYLNKTAGDNDGVVSEHSAKWGNMVKKIAAGVSHAEIIDYKKKNISGIDIPKLYLDIARDLSNKGF